MFRPENFGNGFSTQGSQDVFSNKVHKVNDSYLALRNYSLADWKYEKIKEQIIEFQKDLSDSVDVCIQIASFGESIFMIVDEIGFQNPDMLYFFGSVNGNNAQLIQHVSQLNFLLMTQPKPEPESKPRRIGFKIEDYE